MSAAREIRFVLVADDYGSGAGQEPLADRVEMPWGARNQRFASEDGTQLTLFETPGA